MNTRAVWCFVQHLAGIVNAYTCLTNLDEGNYLLAAISAACVLMMARLRVPARNE